MDEEKVDLAKIANAILSSVNDWKKLQEWHDPLKFAELPQLREQLLAATKWREIADLQERICATVAIKRKVKKGNEENNEEEDKGEDVDEESTEEKEDEEDIPEQIAAVNQRARAALCLVTAPPELQFYFTHSIRGRFPLTYLTILMQRASPAIAPLLPLLTMEERIELLNGVNTGKQLVMYAQLFDLPRTPQINAMLEKLVRQVTHSMADDFSHITIDVGWNSMYRKTTGRANMTEKEEREQIVYMNQLRLAAYTSTVAELKKLGYVIRLKFQPSCTN